MIMNKTELLLNEGWKFHFGECEEAWYQGYDDRAFERVMLPHDWAVAYPFSKQYSSGTGYLTGGIGWYRLHFYLPEEYQGKAIRLVFDGVYKNSQVWVNSYYQGKHPYGYTGFSYDISGIAHFGEQENVVSVKVTHTDIADSRWYTGSGITRKVTLVVEEQVHPAEYGVTFVTEKLVADGKEFPEVQAAVSIHHEICNQTKSRKHVWSAQNCLIRREHLWQSGKNRYRSRQEIRYPAACMAPSVIRSAGRRSTRISMGWKPGMRQRTRMERKYLILQINRR